MTEYLSESLGTEGSSEIKSFSSPRLSAEDKLYVRVYLHTLSHAKAYEAVRPGLVKYSNGPNIFSKKEAISHHISVGLQEKAESLTLSPETILDKLYKEATREGQGSNHAARIQALIQLGKHFGLFEEKKENASHTFNIINYSPPTSSSEGLVEKLELLEEEEEQVEPTGLEDSVEFTFY